MKIINKLNILYIIALSKNKKNIFSLSLLFIFYLINNQESEIFCKKCFKYKKFWL